MLILLFFHIAMCACMYALHVRVCIYVCVYVCTYVTRFTKRVLYTHSFRSHFSQSFDRHNNKPTVHACTIAKASCLYHCQGFNGVLLLKPHSQACLASTDAQVVCKWLQLAQPGKYAAGRESLQDWFCMVRLGMDVATF